MPMVLYTSNRYESESAASNNIAEHLKALGGKDLLFDTKVKRIVDIPTNFKSDYLIVASAHKSEKSYPALTAHFPGNWDRADYGGRERTLNIAYASKLKLILQKLVEGNERYGLGWHVNMEADHHGPTCNLPIIFVEIGSGPEEWKNDNAGRIVAEAILYAVETEKRFPAYIGVGGGHYAPKFTAIMLNGKEAVGHIIPKYSVDAIEEDTFRQAIEKNVEKIDGILLDAKGVNSRQAEKIERLAAEHGIKIIEV